MRTAVNERRVRNKKSFMDYAMWINFPLDIAFCVYFVVKIYGAFQQGIDKALESAMCIMDRPPIEAMIGVSMPIIGVTIAVSLVMDLIYIILRQSGKKPYIIEKYAIGFVAEKIFVAVFWGLTIVVFS